MECTIHRNHYDSRSLNMIKSDGTKMKSVRHISTLPSYRYGFLIMMVATIILPGGCSTIGTIANA
jgi:hypothetical protein